MRRTAVLSAIALTLVAGTALVSAQEPFVRAPLQKVEYPAGFETHVMLVTSAPGAPLPRHTHPGVEISYVVEGELTVTIEGKEPVVVKAGSSFAVPAGAPHSAKNTASIPTKVLATFVIEKGKPITSPAP